MPKADGSHSSGTKLAQIRSRRATMPGHVRFLLETRDRGLASRDGMAGA